MDKIGRRARIQFFAISLAVLLPFSGANAAILDPIAFGLQQSSALSRTVVGHFYAIRHGGVSYFETLGGDLQFSMDVTNREIDLFSYHDTTSTSFGYGHRTSLGIFDSYSEPDTIEIVAEGLFEDFETNTSYDYALIVIELTGFTGALFDTLSYLPALEKIEALASFVGNSLQGGPIPATLTFTALEPFIPPPLPLPADVPLPPGIALALPVLFTGLLAAHRRTRAGR